MSVVSTDDAARRVPFIWMGPEDFDLPFEARGEAWLAALVLVPVGWVLVWLLTPTFLLNEVVPAGFLAVAAHVVIALVGGTAAAVWVIRTAGRHIKPTTPLAHHVATVQNELDAPRPVDRVTHTRSVPPDLFIEDRPEHRRTHVVAVPRLVAQWKS